jgi:hypothetical protein
MFSEEALESLYSCQYILSTIPPEEVSGDDPVRNHMVSISQDSSENAQECAFSNQYITFSDLDRN